MTDSKPSAAATPAPPAAPAAAAKPATPARKSAAAQRPMAKPATWRRRHLGLGLSFVITVLLPVLATAGYLYGKAEDQYASVMAFTVRSEDVSSAVDVLGGLSRTLGGGSASRDSDILYEFIRSQELVAAIDARLDLRRIYSRPRASDPLLSFDPEGTVEDLTRYWQRMVRTAYDSATGMMELRVLAFEAGEAQQIAEAIRAESTRMINDLTAIAREDAMRYAREDLTMAVERLKVAREALTTFRIAHQIVDVRADIQGQMGLLNTLSTQLAAALIELDLVAAGARSDDPRVQQAQRRVAVIEARMAEERLKFGPNGRGPGGESYAATISEFERLTVEREFAERAYVAALSAHDGARAEANRQSRYLATYIRPSKAEKSEYPQRAMLTGLVAMFSMLLWSIASLTYYSLRDRR